jgi:hypothetical protein
MEAGQPSSPAISTRAALPAFTDRLALAPDLPGVSPICVGMVRDASAIAAAFERGCNFFFVSCDMHWPLYAATRSGLSTLIGSAGRDAIVVAAVVYVTQPEFQSAPIGELIDETAGLERVDVVVAGGAYGAELLPRLDVMHGHRSARRFGARAVGASFHDRAAARLAIAHRLVDVAFVRFNAAHPGARDEVFAHTGPSAPPLFGFNSTRGHVPGERLRQVGLGDADWAPSVSDHYRYALSHVGVDGILCSPSKPAEVEALADALATGPLGPDECHYLEKLCLLDRGQAELG